MQDRFETALMPVKKESRCTVARGLVQRSPSSAVYLIRDLTPGNSTGKKLKSPLGGSMVESVSADQSHLLCLIHEHLRLPPVHTKVISLFSGAGGMDLGFRLAGFEPVWAIDSSVTAWQTYQRNIGLRPKCKKIERVRHFPRATGATGLVACAPCQGFSMIGMRNEDDPRNLLYRSVARCIRQLRPRFFVFENVRGLSLLYGRKFLHRILRAYKRLGYDVSWKLVDAADYGVPQHRKRLIIIGFRKDLKVDYKFPDPTHGPGKIPYVTLRDVLNDLPAPRSDEYYHQDDWPFFYMSRNRRATWGRPSYTIQTEPRHIALHPSCPPMRHVEKDKWVFTKGAGSYRRLSVRECARIQTFPDWFEFAGALDAQYRQVGNAVPPLLAEVIANSVAEHLLKKPKKPKERALVSAQLRGSKRRRSS